jgi:TonB-linked SusC/RagA family outer membrane protein
MGAAALVPLLAFAQQGTGTITGRVTETGTGQPVADANVVIVGTTRGARTDAEGRYRIADVPAGPAQVRALRIGYSSTAQTVTIASGATNTADFALSTAAISLDRVLVTATGGEQRRVEVGNAVSNINVEEVQKAAVPNGASLLQGRAPGVTVIQNGGTTGTSARVRIRGANSINLSNEPLLIIDNIRVNNSFNSFSIGTGGQSVSRLNDLNPDEIESIDILKGPAASALYGTAAANGVIQVTTKRGRSGKATYSVYGETGSIKPYDQFPANYNSYAAGGANPSFCFLADVATAVAGCTAIDSLFVYSPLVAHSPFRTGHNNRGGFQTAGGNDAAQYFVSTDINDETGVFLNNRLRSVNLRSNLNLVPFSKLRVQVNGGYLTSRASLPQNDNNNLGIVPNGLLGKARENEPVEPASGSRLGFFLRAPSKLYAVVSDQDIERFTGGLTGNYTPLSWFQMLGTLGYDALNRFDAGLLQPNILDNNTSNRIGSRTANRYQIYNYTANISGTATFNLGSSFVSKTSAGTQFQRENFTDNQAFGTTLVAGTGSLAGTSTGFAVGEDQLDNRTLGYFGQQQFEWGERVFLTGALRGDKNSAFGRDFKFAKYPSGSLSYVISRESWFPTSFINTFKLRGAYGVSGLRPGPVDALQYFNPTAVNVVGVETAAINVGNLGDPNLRPEKVREGEVGFESSMFGDRLGLDFTYFNKQSKDALISRTLPSGAGTAAAQLTNIGRVENKGIELQATLGLLRMDKFGWDATLNYATVHNKLIDLGKDLLGNDIQPIIFGLGGASQRHTEGRPLGSYYQETYTYADANNDGIIDYNEVTIGDTAYLGNPLPTHTWSLNSTMRFFNSLRLSTLVDAQRGFKQYNSTEEFRCGTVFNCPSLYVAGTPLWLQARAIANINFGTAAGYIEDASYVKLREIALTWDVPAQFASRLGMTRGVSLTLAGRNLHTWTNYTGLDPEINFTTANFTQAEFLSQPPVKRYIARLNINF